jgi:hypothetical protein
MAVFNLDAVYIGNQMKLFEFFSQDNEVPKYTIIFMSTVAGICGPKSTTYFLSEPNERTNWNEFLT